ncbi:hypothetical protein ABT061_23580 [Streptosporangium sp. NPDC002544]|uniref:hypothetical protein n=1 Tax=Streptosporangium sp. NPDC002544 TaxID=3154538 RepID=UPI00332AA805
MEYRQLFREIHKRPGMYGLDGSFKSYEAFLMGCDAGNDWGLFSGFREWLIMRLGSQSSFGWPGLVLQLALPEKPSLPLSPESDAKAVELLFELLDQFMEERAPAHGVANIFEKYQSWLSTQWNPAFRGPD